MATIGNKIPEVELNVFHEDEFKKIKLNKDYKGKWLVLFLYPADFTSVCSSELEEVVEFYEEIKNLGAEIISISTDTHFTHKAFHASSPGLSKITYPMAGDPAGSVAKELGTYIAGVGLSFRGTFIFNPDGELKVFEVQDTNIARSTIELIRKLQSAKFVYEHKGEVCMAGWKPEKVAAKR